LYYYLFFYLGPHITINVPGNKPRISMRDVGSQITKYKSTSGEIKFIHHIGS